MPPLLLVPLCFNLVCARPNLVMWLVDDLGWGSVRFNGNSKVAATGVYENERQTTVTP